MPEANADIVAEWESRRAFWQIAFWSLVVHMVAALCSTGWHHPDEHFQILEFANQKLRGFDPDLLPWEFGAQIRPWLQPWLAVGLFRGLQQLGIDNPFTWATILKVLGALLGWAGALTFGWVAQRWFYSQRARYFVHLGVNLLWFIPYLHARTSSENLSTTFFFVGLAALLWRLPDVAKSDPTNEIWRPSATLALLAGLLMGVAFEFRFQTGVMVACVGFWLLFQRHTRAFFALALGVVLPIIGALWIDHWGYGAWVFPPWNYLYVNVVENKAAEFGVSPWYFYLTKSVSRSVPTIGLVFLIFVPIAWLRFPRHILTWSTLPFLVVHSALQHKEMRFMYPIAPALAPLALLGLRTLPQRLRDWFNTQSARRWIMWLVIVPNMLYLAVASVRPLRGEYFLFKYLYGRSAERVEIASVDPEGPYISWAMNFNFYGPKETDVTIFETYESFVDDLAASPSAQLLFIRGPHLPPEAGVVVPHCEVAFQTFPRWLHGFDAFRRATKRVDQAIVLRCRHRQHGGPQSSESAPADALRAADQPH